jgi:hypothetical protein
MSKSKPSETYFGRATSEPEAGGRWARPKPTISGAGGAGVPKQPATSPWARDPVGQEQPLGIDVDAMEPVGEPHEVERSLRQQEEPEGSE